MCMLCQATGRTKELPVVSGFSCSQASATTTNVVSASTPVFSNDQIAYQLTNTFWGGSDRSFNVGIGGTISVNITALTSAGQTLARQALELWTDTTGLSFSFTSGSANITFDDTDVWSAWNWSSTGGGNIYSSNVNVGTSWIGYYGTGINTYSLQTYVHEIGHALGLGHAGNYNGSADYGVDNHYANDSWQASVMSYFNQYENTYINASYTYAITPMVADIIAIRNLYGTTASTRTGNTTYGDNANSGDIMQTISSMNSYISYTIVDDGGIDTLDFSSSSANQSIDLHQEKISNVRGYTGNLVISRGTVIENVIGGSGNDKLLGNNSSNTIVAGSGNDMLNGSDTHVVHQNEVIDSRSINGNSSVALSGDFNGDERDDLIFFWPHSGKNRLFSSKADGDFGYNGSQIDSATINGSPERAIVGDFNGDGQDDLFFAWTETGQNRLLFGQTDQDFKYAGQRISSKAINGNANDVIASDFNGDGKDDLLFIWRETGLTRLFLGHQNGTFMLADTGINRASINGSPHQILSGDFNGDGKFDLIFTWLDSGENRAYFSNGLGTFDYFRNIIDPRAINNKPSHVLTGDYDGDNTTDALFFWDESGQNRIFYGSLNKFSLIYRQNEISPTAINGAPSSIVSHDFNKDSVDDLAFYWDEINLNRFYSGNNEFKRGSLSLSNDWFSQQNIIVPGDYDGDNIEDTFIFSKGKGENTLMTSTATDGDDIFYGSSGSDTFEFLGRNFGNDVIMDYTTSDKLVFSKSAFENISALVDSATEYSNVTSYVKIELNSSNSVTIWNTDVADILSKIELI